MVPLGQVVTVGGVVGVGVGVAVGVGVGVGVVVGVIVGVMVGTVTPELGAVEQLPQNTTSGVVGLVEPYVHGLTDTVIELPPL